MGSTAPFDKLKKKKKTVITLKKLLSEVAEPGVKMGNLCSLGAAAKKVMGNSLLYNVLPRTPLLQYQHMAEHRFYCTICKCILILHNLKCRYLLHLTI